MKATIKRRYSVAGFIAGGTLAAGISRCCNAADASLASSASAASAAPIGAASSAQRWSDMAHRLNDWHAIVMVLCLVIIVAVFGALLYSILARRKSEEASGGNFHKRTAVEVIWAVLPFVIVIGMALPTARTVLDGPAPLAPGEHAVAATPERSVQCNAATASAANARPGCP